MGLLAEVQTMNIRESRKEQEQKKRQKQIEKIQKQKETEKEEKQYLKDLTTACKNDLKAEFENEYKQIGTKAKYYFYDIEIREKTIKNILNYYNENTTNLYDYLDANYIKLLNEIDKKYQYNEEAQKAKRQELEKLNATLNQRQIQMQNTNTQKKQQNKETIKNIIFNLLQYTFSLPGMIILIFILIIAGYFYFGT